MTKFLASLGVALSVALGAVSCGGGDSPSSPSPTPTPTPDQSSATITITASGASPRTVTIPAGGRVTFVNNDSRAHDMTSDPHPAHTDCPALNQVGNLQPNQSRTSGNLTTVRTCGFHDHLRESDASLRGTIVIQ